MSNLIITKDIKTGSFNAIQRAIKDLESGPYVLVGILEKRFDDKKDVRQENESIKISLGSVAIINEFGSPDQRIPERSFVRSTFDENQVKWSEYSKKLSDKVFNGEISIAKALGIIGEVIKADIQAKIVSLRTPPNAPATIRKKKSSNPLIDTGQLRQSIDYEIFIK